MNTGSNQLPCLYWRHIGPLARVTLVLHNKQWYVPDSGRISSRLRKLSCRSSDPQDGFRGFLPWYPCRNGARVVVASFVVRPGISVQAWATLAETKCRIHRSSGPNHLPCNLPTTADTPTSWTLFLGESLRLAALADQRSLPMPKGVVQDMKGPWR